MASAKAMARIDWTRIGVAAPGLRPTASDAFMPMMPTAMAAPNAANAMCRLPVMFSCPSFRGSSRSRPGVDPPSLISSVVRGGSFFVMLANEQREHGGQQHEHQRLDHADQQLQKI